MNKKLKKLIGKGLEFDNDDDARDFIFNEMEAIMDELTDDDFNELIELVSFEQKKLLEDIKEYKKQRKIKK